MKIHLWLNGKEISDEISPDMPLLEYVRTKGCYSVKRGCETSNCGLCTVWMNKKPVLSCSVLAARADGKEIVTLEGVQERAAEFGTYLANQGGEQCGFCNPGFIMNVLAMEDELNNPTEEEIKAYLSGNLCRCSGYESQLRAIKNYLNRNRIKSRRNTRRNGYEICKCSRDEKRCHGACDGKTSVYGRCGTERLSDRKSTQSPHAHALIEEINIPMH